jgi:hypothetical protein
MAWFDRTSVDDHDWVRAEGVPLGRIYEIADEARRRARAWTEFAQVLEARAGKKAARSFPPARRAG